MLSFSWWCLPWPTRQWPLWELVSGSESGVVNNQAEAFKIRRGYRYLLKVCIPNSRLYILPVFLCHSITPFIRLFLSKPALDFALRWTRATAATLWHHLYFMSSISDGNIWPFFSVFVLISAVYFERRCFYPPFTSDSVGTLSLFPVFLGHFTSFLLSIPWTALC